ncbi:hypothetical protein BGX24_000611 [Mortierella sp. AD032]|nr:hypothetical protein BGX24_000611 [Mortierella sp. AD032]
MSQVIAIHCPKLAVCRSTSNPWYINEYNRTPDDPTNQFLVDCASLKEFNYIEHAIWVDELLRQPWACLGLEWLRCRIVGVSRLSRQEEAIVDRVMTMRKKEVAGESGRVEQQLTEEETAAVEKFHQCERQHHGVYDQLARLTRLKHLDLGYESRYPWTFKHDNTHYEWKGVEYSRYPDGKTFDTLEFSLESGLDRLRALKDLEMIGFECLNHRIGRKELEWMAKSWPRLKLMYGLDEERLYMIERDEERAALKEYFEELRPDVVHDSLFQDNM